MDVLAVRRADGLAQLLHPVRHHHAVARDARGQRGEIGLEGQRRRGDRLRRVHRDEAELGLGHGEGDLELQHGAQLGLDGEMPRDLLVAEQGGEPGMIEDGNAHAGNLPAIGGAR